VSTFGEMKAEVKDNLVAEGIEAPGTIRVEKLLNRAKNEIVAVMESLFENDFTTTATYTVTAGDASIALPDGYTLGSALNITDPDEETAPPAFRRIIGLTRTDLGQDEEAVIIAPHQRHDQTTYTGMEGNKPILYRQGNTLRFDSESGAGASMTLVLRYAQAVPDLTGNTDSERYDLIRVEWDDLIVTRATLHAVPAEHLAQGKYRLLYADRINQLREFGQQSIRTGPAHVRMEE